MSWLADLLGNLLQVAGSNYARRRTWNWVNGPTVSDDAVNKRLDHDFANVRTQQRERTLTTTDLTALAGFQSFDLGSMLPAGSHVLGTEIEIAREFTGGGASYVTADIGSAGDTDAIVDGADLFAAPVDGQCANKPNGISPNKSWVNATLLTVRIASDANLNALTTGECTLRVLFAEVPL